MNTMKLLTTIAILIIIASTVTIKLVLDKLYLYASFVLVINFLFILMMVVIYIRKEL